MSDPLPSVAPFASTFSPEAPDLLAALRCSLALSTYQAGRVVLFSPQGEQLAQLNRTFDAPMGLGVSGEGASLRLAVAEKAAVHVLGNAPALAPTYPRQRDTYDALLLPRQTIHTGPLDLHDLAFTPKGLLAVNTRFSCLCRLGGVHSFEPVWTPPFISGLAPEDRCHLNGLAVDASGAPTVVSALGTTDTPRGWSEDRLTGGVLVDVASGETLASGLAMPHSPRLAHDRLYVLLSATGHLAAVDRASGHVETVCNLGGFARGLAVRGDYLIAGVSKIRRRSTFADLPVSQTAGTAGVVIVHAPSGRIAARISFESSVEEIYDVAVLPEVARPGLVGLGQEVLHRAIVTSAGGYWALDAPPEASGA
ncbi:MAG: TIGR03032 family protein [Bacteroidota bacterium]